MRAKWILGCSAVLALASVPASAQPVVAAKSGTVSVADGQVFLDDKLLEIQPGQFPDMKEKSVLRTEEGRAEVLLPPGMFLRVGEKASFRMVSNRLVDTRVELLTGSGVVEIDATSKDAQVTMVLKDGTVTFTKGIYRFDAEPARLKVFDGSADVAIGGHNFTVASGKMIGLSSDSASVERFDIKDTDSLDHWSRRRGEELAMANVSAAKRAQGNTWSASVNPCLGMGVGPYAGVGPSYAMGAPGYGVWTYNPWYGMYTYMPCNGYFMSPYGYSYWSPFMVYRLYYNPGMFFNRGGLGGGGFNSGGGVIARGLTGGGVAPGRGSMTSAGTISHGYSGVVSAASSAGSARSGGPIGGGGSFGGGAAAGGGGAGGGGHASGGGFGGGGGGFGGGAGGGHAGGGGAAAGGGGGGGRH